MSKGNAVVDGSNIATEGRTEPSLKQLREAIEEFQAENHFKHVIVIVDASFEHRVSAREKKAARDAIDAGELLTPPAGVIGRGDAFILEVADRAQAVVLSNDSFQEFHGTYKWLFDEGRLIGGKPVPGVGWVYVPRAPVRGPVSRRATSDARKKSAKATAKRSSPAEGAPGDDKVTAAPGEPRPAIGASKKSKQSKQPKRSKQPKEAKPTQPSRSARATRPSSGDDASNGANPAAVWEEFRHDYPVGTTVAAEVERFSSHGAYGSVGDAVVYLPNRLLGDPAPNRARDVLTIGETRDFLVHEFDEERRGIDLGLVPVPEGAAAEPPPAKKTARRRSVKKTAKSPARKAAAKKPAKKTTAKKSAAKKAAKKTTAKKSAAKTTKKAAKKTTAKKPSTRSRTRKQSSTAT